MQNIYNMKTFFTNSMLLLSSISVNSGFYNPAFIPQLNRVDYRFESIKNGNKPLEQRRRKGIEDIMVDGFIDSTKKLLSFETADSDSSNKKRRNIKTFQPKTPNQHAFLDLMRDDNVDIVIAIGPAGTGKTMLACYAAVEALRLGKVNKIVVTRPVVSVDEEIGFLPGDIESKMDPWTRPIFDILQETYSAKEIEKMTEEGVIEIVPLGFMRGRTFKNAWIIADEMQNSSPTQMFMLATRIGEGSKMIITGDLNQSDLNPTSNGLLEINNKVRNSEKMYGVGYVRHIELETEDVQRSRAAKLMLDIWECSNATHKKNSEKPDKENIQPISVTHKVIDSLTLSDKNDSANVRYLHETPNATLNDIYFSQEVKNNEDDRFSNEFEYFNQSVNIKSCATQNKKTVTFEANDDAALIPKKHMNQLKKYF
jgi:phosphate starvation-inducible PhoH-like protein